MADIRFQQFLTAFSIGITRVYEDNLKQHQKTYTAILREETARHWFDTEWLTSGLGQMPKKNIGAAITTDTIMASPTVQYELDAYALGVVIEYEAYRWDLYGIFEGFPSELAKSAVDRYNVLGYAVYLNSFSAPTSGYQIYSGENMISATHARLDGGTWSNQLAANPGLSYLAIQDALVNLGKLVNERGRLVIVNPKTLICALDQRWIANEILQSQYRPDSGFMNKNTLNGSLDVHSSPYLSSAPTYWWLLTDKRDLRAYMRLGEGPMLQKDQDIRTKALIFTSYCSMNTAVFDSRGLFGSTGGA